MILVCCRFTRDYPRHNLNIHAFLKKNETSRVKKAEQEKGEGYIYRERERKGEEGMRAKETEE